MARVAQVSPIHDVAVVRFDHMVIILPNSVQRFPFTESVVDGGKKKEKTPPLEKHGKF